MRSPLNELKIATPQSTKKISAKYYFAIQNIETLKKFDIVWVGKNERPGEQILHSIVTGGRTIYERAS